MTAWFATVAQTVVALGAAACVTILAVTGRIDGTSAIAVIIAATGISGVGVSSVHGHSAVVARANSTDQKGQ